MPLCSRLLVRTALAWLVAALALQLLDAWGRSRGWALLEALRGAQLHALTVGWLTQLIFGVAWWLFPRRRDPEPTAVGVAIWAALNLGLLLRLAAEPLAVLRPGTLPAAGLVASAGLQLAAAATFSYLAWRRVRPARAR